uniref:DUF4806 domain-containing protein n=1 Tax=Glossina brevipalpis TaxID=37001 RepID=A0A1A9WFC1_9MUSC
MATSLMETPVDITTNIQKCGEITIRLEFDKKIYGLHCIFCNVICLQLDAFIEHIQEQHEAQLTGLQSVIKEELHLDDEQRANETYNGSRWKNERKKNQKLDSAVETYIVKEEPMEAETNSLDEIISKVRTDLSDSSNSSLPAMNVMPYSDDFRAFLNDNQLDFENCSKLNLQTVVLTRVSKLEKDLERTTSILSKLSAEMLKVKRDVNKMTKHDDIDEKELPIQSYEAVEDFLEFDEKYKNPEKLKLLSNNFLHINAPTSIAYVFKCWRSLLKDNAAKYLNWTGTGSKHPVRNLASTTAIRDAFARKYPNDSIDVFESKTKKFFLYASDRISKRRQQK